MLIMLQGEARITHDNGGTWRATGTGQHLQAGDEIQTTEDAIALVFLLNGGVGRLEGPSDFQIIRAEYVASTGASRIIVKLWDGYGLFEANPLPTADSIFEFLVMTTYIGLNYDAVLAAIVGSHAALDPERSVIGGGLLNEQTEMLYHFRGPVSLYLLDQINAVTFAAELPAALDQYAELEAALLDDLALEAELEAFAPIAGYLIATASTWVAARASTSPAISCRTSRHGRRGRPSTSSAGPRPWSHRNLLQRPPCLQWPTNWRRWLHSRRRPRFPPRTLIARSSDARPGPPSRACGPPAATHWCPPRG